MSLVTVFRGDITTIPQSISTSEWTVVMFDVIEPDGRTAIYSAVNGEFIAPITGKYRISSNVSFTADPGDAGIRIIKNGESMCPLLVRSNGITNNRNVSIDTIVTLYGGEYIQIQVFQQSGGAIDIASLVDVGFIGLPGRTTNAIFKREL